MFIATAVHVDNQVVGEISKSTDIQIIHQSLDDTFETMKNNHNLSTEILQLASKINDGLSNSETSQQLLDSNQDMVIDKSQLMTPYSGLFETKSSKNVNHTHTHRRFNKFK